MKGIILAGGSGTRLYPLTKVVNKQLLPIYDKPMIFYSLSTLILAEIKEILVISTTKDLELYKELLGDGSRFGIKLSYVEQPHPDGLAQAFILGESFLNGDACALILGDNIFYGNNLKAYLIEAKENAERNNRGTVFGYYVSTPKQFGVVEFDVNGKAISIEEKPQNPKSNYAVTGLYFYPAGISEKAKLVKPSERGELEITTLNEMYLKNGVLDVKIFDDRFAWLDTGTMQSLLQAAIFVETLQKSQGIVIGSPEVIAYMNGFIDEDKLKESAKAYGNSEYGEILKRTVEDKE